MRTWSSGYTLRREKGYWLREGPWYVFLAIDLLCRIGWRVEPLIFWFCRRRDSYFVKGEVIDPFVKP